jgi:diadenylate cyclase
MEIAHEGCEGPRIGTLFTLGDADRVMADSRHLVLNPDLRGTLKELAQLDGA